MWLLAYYMYHISIPSNMLNERTDACSSEIDADQSQVQRGCTKYRDVFLTYTSSNQHSSGNQVWLFDQILSYSTICANLVSGTHDLFSWIQRLWFWTSNQLCCTTCVWVNLHWTKLSCEQVQNAFLKGRKFCCRMFHRCPTQIGRRTSYHLSSSEHKPYNLGSRLTSCSLDHLHSEQSVCLWIGSRAGEVLLMQPLSPCWSVSPPMKHADECFLVLLSSWALLRT